MCSIGKIRLERFPCSASHGGGIIEGAPGCDHLEWVPLRKSPGERTLEEVRGGIPKGVPSRWTPGGRPL